MLQSQRSSSEQAQQLPHLGNEEIELKQQLHPSFTAGSHIVSSSCHILYRSVEGTLWRHMKQSTDNIDIEFDLHDGIDQTFKNTEQFECGVFTNKGAFVASHPDVQRSEASEEQCLLTHSMIKFKKYDLLDPFTEEWDKFLPSNSFAVALALNEQKLVCACSNGIIYIYLHNGLLWGAFTHPRKIVTVFTFENKLGVIHQSLSILNSQLLLLTIYDITTIPRQELSGIEIPLGREKELEWAGFTRWGVVSIQLSNGNVMMHLNGNWHLVCKLPSSHRVHCVDFDCVTSFSIQEPRGAFKDNQIGNFLIVTGPKTISSVSSDIQRLKILLLIAVENHVRGQKGVHETAKEIKEMLELRKIQGFFIALQEEQFGKALDFVELIRTPQGFEECMKLAVLQGAQMLVDILSERARLKNLKTCFNMVSYKAESGIRAAGGRIARTERSYKGERLIEN